MNFTKISIMIRNNYYIIKLFNEMKIVVFSFHCSSLMSGLIEDNRILICICIQRVILVKFHYVFMKYEANNFLVFS